MIHRKVLIQKLTKHVGEINKILKFTGESRKVLEESLENFKAYTLDYLESLPEVVDKAPPRPRFLKKFSQEIADIDWTQRDNHLAKFYGVTRERMRQIREMAGATKIPKAKDDTLKIREMDKEALEGKSSSELQEMFPDVTLYTIHKELRNRGITYKKDPRKDKLALWDHVNFDLPNILLGFLWNKPHHAFASARNESRNYGGKAKWNSQAKHYSEELLEAVEKEKKSVLAFYNDFNPKIFSQGFLLADKKLEEWKNPTWNLSNLSSRVGFSSDPNNLKQRTKALALSYERSFSTRDIFEELQKDFPSKKTKRTIGAYLFEMASNGLFIKEGNGMFHAPQRS